MAIAFLNAANTGQTSGGSHSVSITVPVGTDILFVNGWSSAEASSCTIGGNAMTGINKTTGSSTQVNKLWYYLSPPTGTQTLAVSGGSGTTGSLWAAYSGAKQSGQPDSSAVVEGNAPLNTPTTVVATGCWLVAAQGDASGGATAGSGTTQRSYNASWGCGIYDSNGTVGTGSQSLNFVNGSGITKVVIASFSPVPASGPTNLKSLDGNVAANIKSFDGNVIANIKSIDGNS